VRLITLLLLLPAPLCAQYTGGSHYHAPNYVKDEVIRVKEKIRVIAVPVAPDYYYSVGADQEELEAKIDRAVERRLKAQRNADPAPPADEEDLVKDDFKVLGGRRGTLDDKVLAVFNTSCVQCHKPGATKPGNIQLFTSDRKLFADPDPKREAARRARVYQVVEDGDMPKNKPRLPQAPRDAIKEWAERAGK
jgi:hypothetical protein